jgi:hypothetical protein
VLPGSRCRPRQHSKRLVRWALPSALRRDVRGSAGAGCCARQSWARRPSRGGRTASAGIRRDRPRARTGVVRARDGLRPGTAGMALANLDEMAFVGCFSTHAWRGCANVEKSRAQSSEDRDGGYDEKAQRVAVR